eukprot:m.32132 g.32132  ORF g.32132 m.32132 type:complete len:151 (+) comp4862_c0_seq1:473-925(+)
MKSEAAMRATASCIEILPSFTSRITSIFCDCSTACAPMGPALSSSESSDSSDESSSRSPPGVERSVLALPVDGRMDMCVSECVRGQGRCGVCVEHGNVGRHIASKFLVTHTTHPLRLVLVQNGFKRRTWSTDDLAAVTAVVFALHKRKFV